MTIIKIKKHTRNEGEINVKSHDRVIQPKKASSGSRQILISPELSTQKEINHSLKKSKQKINEKLNSEDKRVIKQVLKDFKIGRDTKYLHSIKGKYTPTRQKIHNNIIQSTLKQDRITKYPDLYMLGGVASSGKTSALSKKIHEKAVIVNNDDIKSALAKVTPSPSKRFELIHAPLLHRESKDIENEIIRRLKLTKKDIIFDRTISDYDKNLKMIKEFEKLGYEINTLATNLKPHVAVKRASKRFLDPNENGRYVPIEKIGNGGNQINKNVLKLAKNKINKKAYVVNTYHRKKQKVIFEK